MRLVMEHEMYESVLYHGLWWRVSKNHGVPKCGVSWDTKTLLLNHTFSMLVVNQDFCVLVSKQAQRFGD